MLYKLAQNGFQPAKYFSIDRVFRNEAIDKTHLAEFHQVGGWVHIIYIYLSAHIHTHTRTYRDDDDDDGDDHHHPH